MIDTPTNDSMMREPLPLSAVVRPRSLLKRAFAGLLGLAVLTSAFAWLLHSTIEADAGTVGEPSAIIDGHRK